MRQGSNEILENYMPRLKKVWKSIHSKLDGSEICGIFRDSILPIINLHAPSNNNMGFGVLVQELLQKEKVFLELGDHKYTYTPYTKENRITYIKKEEKTMNMANTPTSPPKLIRSTTKRERRYTFPIQPRLL